jgi:hypothetical protein
LSETLVEPDANDPEATTLELDELWSFVLQKSNKVGFGLPSAERHGKLLHELLMTEARRLAVKCGMPFQTSIALDIILPISGMHIKQSFRQEQHSAVGNVHTKSQATRLFQLDFAQKESNE